MRTIKFRGIIKKSDELFDGWVYGDLINYANGIIAIRQQETGQEFEVNPESVGQFTGVFDKNGKEIFEHDVLKIESGSLLWGVIFDTNKGHFTCKGINNDAKMDYIPFYHCEIINNITDNPETLKK